MNRSSFLHGVVAALVLSLAGAALARALLMVGHAQPLRAALSAVALAYLLYLLGTSRSRSGRPSTLALWLLGAGAAWLCSPSLAAWLVVNALLLWLARVFTHRASLAGALADLGLVALGLLGALWAAAETGSLGAALWCFLLVQALHPWIPAQFPQRAARVSRSPDRFAAAHHQGEAALRRLLARH